MPELFCPSCNKETLVLKEPVYEGFTRVGEITKCAVCGHVFTAPADPDAGAPPARKLPAFFSEDDLPKKPSLFAEGENRVICRYCAHYLVNPFKQWCGFHRKEVEATDTCSNFSAKPDSNQPV
ncbi:MAG TPA: hypothetical protein PKE26_02670 [Kiritimatiellia bacterium]|nr:hypothetical protein [Kiritimatiellia bacterium]HMO97992.1 hypothetical protein [Kiritimatiellia bacterium]HMP95343.1 hypothetical protein [Kiritimatiellia bacterium]